jgi:hypothetical protein
MDPESDDMRCQEIEEQREIVRRNYEIKFRRENNLSEDEEMPEILKYEMHHCIDADMEEIEAEINAIYGYSEEMEEEIEAFYAILDN